MFDLFTDIDTGCQTYYRKLEKFKEKLCMFSYRIHNVNSIFNLFQVEEGIRYLVGLYKLTKRVYEHIIIHSLNIQLQKTNIKFWFLRYVEKFTQ